MAAFAEELERGDGGPKDRVRVGGLGGHAEECNLHHTVGWPRTLHLLQKTIDVRNMNDVFSIFLAAVDAAALSCTDKHNMGGADRRASLNSV